jgi:hypothetical protein
MRWEINEEIGGRFIQLFILKIEISLSPIANQGSFSTVGLPIE